MTWDGTFLAAFLSTVALLAAVFVTGKRALRRLHVALVVLTLASLAATIGVAERMGERYDLASAGWITPVHLTLAKATAAAYVLPLASGVLTSLRPRARAWHRRLAWTVLVLTLVTAVTGAWMILASDPIGPVAVG